MDSDVGGILHQSYSQIVMGDLAPSPYFQIWNLMWPLCLSLSLFLSLSPVSVCLSSSLCLCLSLPPCLSLSLSPLCLSVSLSSSLCLPLCLCLSFPPCLSLSISFCVSLSVCVCFVGYLGEGRFGLEEDFQFLEIFLVSLLGESPPSFTVFPWVSHLSGGPLLLSFAHYHLFLYFFLLSGRFPHPCLPVLLFCCTFDVSAIVYNISKSSFLFFDFFCF